MKKIYFAGKFNKIKDSSLSLQQQLINDFRSQILGSSKLLTYATDNLIVNNQFIYKGPFYCEEASNGDYTSIDCDTIINAEYEAIYNSDTFIVVFNDSFSVGSVVELGWAINLDKEIKIIFQKESSSYQIKSEYWFAILDAIKRGKNVKVYQYQKQEELILLINQVLEEN